VQPLLDFGALLILRMMHVVAAALLCLNLVHAFVAPSSHAAFNVAKQAHSSRIVMQAHKVIQYLPCNASQSATDHRICSLQQVDNVGVVLLAGGTGSRMKADRPKQFLELRGKSVLQHSLELFLSLEGVDR
jgi:2-C-methyl-D-erythritol 4-phosphate cytidylyltransferase